MSDGEELSDDLMEVVGWIKCAYPQGIPDADYMTLLSILVEQMSFRALSMVVAYIHGGHYPIYMGEVAAATRYIPEPRVRALVIKNLVNCGFREEAFH